jgi:hypothetical protein
MDDSKINAANVLKKLETPLANVATRGVSYKNSTMGGYVYIFIS